MSKSLFFSQSCSSSRIWPQKNFQKILGLIPDPSFVPASIFTDDSCFVKAAKSLWSHSLLVKYYNKYGCHIIWCQPSCNNLHKAKAWICRRRSSPFKTQRSFQELHVGHLVFLTTFSGHVRPTRISHPQNQQLCLHWYLL